PFCLQLPYRNLLSRRRNLPSCPTPIFPPWNRSLYLSGDSCERLHCRYCIGVAKGHPRIYLQTEALRPVLGIFPFAWTPGSGQLCAFEPTFVARMPWLRKPARGQSRSRLETRKGSSAPLRARIQRHQGPSEDEVENLIEQHPGQHQPSHSQPRRPSPFEKPARCAFAHQQRHAVVAVERRHRQQVECPEQ